MAYADKRDGKHTGSFVGEAPKLGKKRRFKTLQDAKDYETFCKLLGREPPTIEDAMGSTGAPTFAKVAELAKERGGPSGKWLRERDSSRMQRLDYCVTIIGPYEIQRVTREVLRKISDSLAKRPVSPNRKEPLSPATINRYLAVAHAVLTFAHLEDILKEHPPKAPYLDEKMVRKERDILEYGQEEVVLQIMRDRGQLVDALCVDMLIQTGLRSGELLKKLGPDQITIEDVHDPETGEVVPVGFLRLHKGQTKNNESREAAFSADLARQIRALIATNSLPDGYQLLRHFKSACEAAGYTGNLVIHSLRHTRATRLMKAGIGKEMRKQLLGHKSDAAHGGYIHSDLQEHLKVVKKVQEHAGIQAKNVPASRVVDFKKAL